MAIREILTANRTYYVRTDGSDSNTGLGNSSGDAFLTMQNAYNVAASLDCNGFSVTVKVAAGAYTNGLAISQPLVGANTIYFVGDTALPGNVTITVTNGHCFLNQVKGVTLDIGGFKMKTLTAGCCAWAYLGGNIVVSNLVTCDAAVDDHFRATEGSLIKINSNYYITGGAVNHWHAYDCSSLICQGRTLGIVGTPNFPGQFCGIAQCSVANVASNVFSGAATGIRYLAQKNGVIDTGAAGASYFPGSMAGSTVAGGQYV